MKKIFIVLGVCILFVNNGQAQKNYTPENLSSASVTELNAYLDKAQKLRKTGGTLLTVGPAAVLAGALLVWTSDYTLFSNDGSDGMLVAGGLMMAGGLTTTIVGIPLRITGSNRINRINKFLSTSEVITLEFTACNFKPFGGQSLQPGMTVRWRF